MQPQLPKYNDIESATDFFAFGMGMPDRTFSTVDYRYGYNSQEKVDEISGSGNHYTAEFWEYDPRVVNRWNIDPMFGKYPGWSPYAINFDNPIWYRDPTGAEGENDEKPASDKVKIGDLPKANSVGEFLVGAADKLKTGDRITGSEIKDFIKPSDNKAGEKALGEILGQIDFLEVNKDGDKTTFTVNLKSNQKELTKEINTPNGDFKVKVKTGTELVINKKSASEVTLDVNKLSVTKLGFINVGVPLGAIGVNINKDNLNISVLGVTVSNESLILPDEFKKKK